MALAFGVMWWLAPARNALGVTEEEFKELRELVTRQGQRLDELEKLHNQDQKTIESNRQVHEQEQQELQRLKRQLSNLPTNAPAPALALPTAAETPPQVQPVHPIPPTAVASHNFTMVGDAEVQFGKVDGSHSAFAFADFAPIFLFRAHDNILFEAGFDVTVQNTTGPASHDAGSSTSVGLTFATLDYAFSDYSMFVGGLMLLPLGTYTERSAGWLNKIPDDPLPRDLLPESGVGIQLRGAIPVGSAGQSLTYALYGANGPSSADGTANHDQLDFGGNVGVKSDGTFGNLHGSPSAGGRLGWFKPWKAHYDLELGLSGQTGTWDDPGRHSWSAGVLDAALHLGPNLEFKGEYIYSWLETQDFGTLHPHGWWVQGLYRLAGLNVDLPLINNIELVGRYDAKRDSAQSINTDRYTLGFVYYFSNTLLFEGDYEFHHSNDEEENHNLFVFQLSYGF